jgi:phosphatidylserine decarboxylase
LTIYGRDVVRKILAVSLMIDLAAYFINIGWLKLTIFAVSVILFSFTLYFFRDPERKVPDNADDNTVISPADGRVVDISDYVSQSDFLPEGNKLKIISVFLSPLNVHVNRIPFTGKIKAKRYINGKYIVAFHEKASELNERSEIIIQNNKGKEVLFKQIAGYVARRIVFILTEGQEVKAGERFGMIKFGSRMDIVFNANSEILVAKNQKVTAGETILARLI